MAEEEMNWFKQAERDIKSAENSLISRDYYVASFLCEQAIEKALKALYLKKKGIIKKVHNLVILAKDLGLPVELIDICDAVNPVYMDTRYPDARGGLPYEHYTEKTSAMDISNARTILQWIKEKL